MHPFAEEMNKARRMAALQARRMAAAGWGVLVIDLLGCGDSSGEFSDARWAAWKRDVGAGIAWLRERVDGAMGLWGLRLGATLAVDSARGADMGIENIVLWQPVVSGEQFLTQFLRLHLAGEMLTGGAAQTGVRELRESLARGTVLEIAGYELHPELAAAVDALRLTELLPVAKTTIWNEVSAQPEPRITPASQRVVDAWRATGLEVRAAAVTGEPFWTTLEITECVALLEATDAAMKGVD